MSSQLQAAAEFGEAFDKLRPRAVSLSNRSRAVGPGSVGLLPVPRITKGCDSCA